MDINEVQQNLYHATETNTSTDTNRVRKAFSNYESTYRILSASRVHSDLMMSPSDMADRIVAILQTEIDCFWK